MNTNPISLMNSTRTSSSNRSSSGSGADTNMFMTLLVAQLKNQDPLQPQDGAAFVAQLAQFNSLDQLIGIRQSIEQLNSQINTGTGSHQTTTATKPASTKSK
jgi:flagellar basal-body rod modification protein FlgD